MWLLWLACKGPAETDTDRIDTDRPDTDVETDRPDTDVGSDCECTDGPHERLIFVMSDDGWVWSFDPVTFESVQVADARCVDAPFTMAVDRSARAWILSSTTHDLQTVDLLAPNGCVDPGYTPDQRGFGLFGSAFVQTDAAECPALYVARYSGSGPFREGDDVGRLGRIDPITLQLTDLGPNDFDGAEVAGTPAGGVWVFGGADPAKLAELDPVDAVQLDEVSLDVSKTHASAFAWWDGAFVVFTEAEPAGCAECLESECADDLAACEADPHCAGELQCAIEDAQITDGCGGTLPTDMSECLQGCSSTCFNRDRVSKALRVDPATGASVELAVLPIRVVGAGTAPCKQGPL